MLLLSLRRALYGATVLFWVVMMSLLIYRNYGPLHEHTAASPSSLPEEVFGEKWMGIYYRDGKIGYSRRDFERQGDGYAISELTKMRLTFMGQQKEIETETHAFLDADLALSSFDLSLKSDVEMVVRGKLEGKLLRVSIDTAGTKSEQTIPLNEKPVLNLTLVPQMIRDGVAPGKRLNISVVDPSTLGQERMTVEAVGKDRIALTGRSIEAMKIKGSFKGTDIFLWMTEKGEILKEESPMGFVLVRESKGEALKGVSVSSDITVRTAVPFNLNIRSGIRYLRVRLSGINFSDFDLDGGRQRLKNDLLDVRMEKLNAKPAPTATDLTVKDEYLRPTIFIQSDDPAVASLSKAIVKGERDRLKAARLICDWVFMNIRKEPSITVPMAAEVLKTRRGDCNEHTTLYVALARAAGIPARTAIGLVFKDGYFYYHAWPEIFAGRWTAVDPTFGQFPADASHIRLITGDLNKQAHIISLIGKIGIEGLEYR